MEEAKSSQRWSQEGLTLLETLISALILMFVLLAMINGYAMSRVQLDREEVKRRAVGLAQDRLEQMRARAVGSLAGWAGFTKAAVDTSYRVSGTDFTLVSSVDDSGSVRKVVSVDVKWTVHPNSSTAVERSIRVTTTIARDITVPATGEEEEADD